MNFRKLNYRRILVWAGIISLLIIYPILYARVLNSPEDRTGADFISLYTAGRIAQEYGSQNVYDLALQRSIQESIIGFGLGEKQVLIYNHMPFLVPPLRWLVSENYVTSYIRWSILSLIVYIAAIVLLMELTRDKPLLFRKKSLLFICSITFFPLFISIVNGQDTAFLFLGVSLWVWGFARERDGVAGMGLALATIRPHIALMLALPFIFKRRKIFLWFVLSAVVLGAISVLLLGPKGTASFLKLLMITASGDWFGMKPGMMVNMLGLVLRLFPSLPAYPLNMLAWVFYFLSIPGLCILWKKSTPLDLRHLATAILAAILFVPHLHYHDLTLLLIPIIVLILYRDDLPLLKDLPELPLIVSVLLLLSGSLLIIKLSLPYLVIATLLILLWLPGGLWHKKESPVMNAALGNEKTATSRQ
jgi:hypothetical protein